MRTIRVVVAEDSLTVRKRLVEVIEAASDLQVVGEAENGKRAFELCQSLRPDVVTMDMMMPVMHGLAATEHIMAYCPTPILIVSASMNRGELFRTFDALSAGAVDVLDKPRDDDNGETWERKFLSTLRLVSRIKVITHVRAKMADLRQPNAFSQVEPIKTLVAPRGVPKSVSPFAPTVKLPVPIDPAMFSRERRNSNASRFRLLAVGASTGGPSAVLDLLRGLRPDFSPTVLIVVHIGQPFGAAFAEWLGEQSPFKVVQAQDGQAIPEVGRAHAILAPPDYHLEVHGDHLRLSQAPERHSCRPSVDVLFESVARELGDRAIACLLTGMGRDGASGLLAIRNAGGRTIAQDEASSVVFGMPREAIALGAAERVFALEDIAKKLRALATEGNWS